MTRTLAVILLSALALSPCLGQAAPAVASLEDTLINLEKTRFVAIVDARVDELDKLMDDTLVYVHSNAKVDSKATYLASLKSGEVDYLSIEPADMKARVYGDTAILNGTARVKVKTGGQESNIHLRFTTVWIERDGDWRMVTWQATRMPE